MKTLQCEVIQKWPGLDSAHPIFQSLDDIVSWKAMPPFNKVGRSSWLQLKEPLVVQGGQGEVRIHSLKIKGVGYLDRQGNINQPTTYPLYRPQSSLGITKDADFFVANSSPGPIGGIVLERALAEYNNACALIENGIPSSVPICVYQYQDPELRFQTAGGDTVPMAVVVTGQLQPTFDRLGSLLDYSDANDLTKAEINRFAESVGIDLYSSKDPELALLRTCYKRYGDHIREFSKCGYYRHSAYWDNLGFSATAGDIYFTDLDSCLELAECSELIKPIQVMRDALSAVYYLTMGFFRKSCLREFSPERLDQTELYQAFLGSYYNDVPIEYINSLTEILKDCRHSTYQRAIAASHEPLVEKSYDFPVHSFQRDYDKKSAFWGGDWINHTEIYCWLVAVMWSLHNRSQISKLYPFQITEDELHTKMSKFGTPQLVETIIKRIDQASK